MSALQFVQYQVLIPDSIRKFFISKIESEYDQEIPQSQTPDRPVLSREEPHINHETPGSQTEKGNQLSLFFPIEMISKLQWTQSHAQQTIKTITESHNGTNNQQRINICRTIALERTAAKATGGLNAFHWHQIYALDSAVVEA